MSSTWHNRTTPRQTTSGWANCKANPLFLTGQATIRASPVIVSLYTLILSVCWRSGTCLPSPTLWALFFETQTQSTARRSNRYP